MSETLTQILWFIILLDLFAAGVMVLLLVNARINLERQVSGLRFYYKAFNVTMNSKTTVEAAEQMQMDVDSFVSYCRMKGIETPEERVDREERIRKDREAQEQRILEEEANWRAEQERRLDERREAQEMEARKRKERLKKFGFK